MSLQMKISIDSEEQAWEALRGLLDGKITVQSIDDIEFGDWVKATVYITENRYDSAISAYMMQGWVEAQRSLYRSFALVANGVLDARTLTDEQRDKLELVVTVNSGSSDQAAALLDVIREVLTGAIKQMDPNTIAIIIIALALIWAGSSVWRTWITERKEERVAETNSKEMLKALETIQTAVAGDADKSRILAEAISKHPVLQPLKIEADNSRQSLLRHTSHVDSTVNGVHLSAEAADALTKNSRSSAIEERRDGNYRITKVDTTVPDGFRVYVENINTSEQFHASVRDALASDNDRALIKEAEWSKTPISLQINARVKDGKVLDAVIIRADGVEEL
jgi:hypothetical protein